MKTRKYNLNALAVGIALALGSMTAAAAPTHPAAAAIGSLLAVERGSSTDRTYQPTFENSELTGLAGVESALSLIAGAVHVDNSFCQGGTKTHSLSVTAFDVYGEVTIDGGNGNGGTTLYVNLLPAGGTSTAAQVDVYGGIGDRLKGSTSPVLVSNYSGLHHWSNGNAIFNDSANWDMSFQNSTPVPYKEVSIKDYFKKLVPDATTGWTESWEFDWGLEKIIKGNYPVAKWTELSWYKRYDGGDGYIKVRKDLVRVGTNGTCRMIFDGTDFVHDGFNVEGEVRVFSY